MVVTRKGIIHRNLETVNSLNSEQCTGWWWAFIIAWKVAWKSSWSDTEQSLSESQASWKWFWSSDEKKQRKQKQQETHKKVEGDGPSAFSVHLSGVLGKFGLTVQEWLRQHLPTLLYTCMFSCISVKKRSRKERIKVPKAVQWVALRKNETLTGQKRQTKTDTEKEVMMADSAPLQFAQNFHYHQFGPAALGWTIRQSQHQSAYSFSQAAKL